jgi:hypothetical protein
MKPDSAKLAALSAVIGRDLAALDRLHAQLLAFDSLESQFVQERPHARAASAAQCRQSYVGGLYSPLAGWLLMQSKISSSVAVVPVLPSAATAPHFSFASIRSFMRVASRQVCIAGITPWPDAAWMEQMARNVSHAEDGFLNGCRYLLRDRDTKFGASFDAILESVGIQAVKLPARSRNLNAHCER